jgi:hypothetical protein
VPPNTSLKDTSLESVKYPLENRIWYAYAGQADNLFGGSYDQPTAVGRVLDDGLRRNRLFQSDQDRRPDGAHDEFRLCEPMPRDRYQPRMNDQ